MLISYEQFLEAVQEGLEKHISRDSSVVPEDQRWEAENFARTLARRLRQHGFNIPRETE